MPILDIVKTLFAAAAMALSTGTVVGQNYPHKPIRMITTEPGSGSDLAARLIAQELVGILGQQVVVDNRGGASGIIAAQSAAKAPPDGYTLFFTGNPFWLLPLLQDKVPYDPIKEFLPITSATRSPNVLVVSPQLPVDSVKELIALAKIKPGQLNYGSGGTGSSNHLAAELFKVMAGVNIVRVPYKGTGPALNDLLGGQLQLMIPNAGSVTQHIKAGRLRALAVTTAQASALVPGLPTVAASGLPGYESALVTGIFAPSHIPVAIINRLNRESVRVLDQADVKERFFNAGVETAGSSPAELAVMMKTEMLRMSKVIKEAGIRVE